MVDELLTTNSNTKKVLNMLKSKNLFHYSKEDHTTEAAEDLPEQGVIMKADAEEVTAVATPEADVEEAGDDIAQALPSDEIKPDYHEDITQADPVDDYAPLEGAAAAELTGLFEEGAQAQSAKDEIVTQAAAESGAGGEEEQTDVNGNAITEEQAAVNTEEDDEELEVEDDIKEEHAAKDIHAEVEEVNENADEELSEAINDDEPDGELGSDTDESSMTSEDGSFGSDDDVGSGDDSGDMGIDTDLDDSTPLEGADNEGGEDGADNLGSDSGTGDIAGGEEGGEESDLTGDESEAGGEESADGSQETGDPVDVDEDVLKQNEAAEVTDEATGATDAEADVAAAGDGAPPEGEALDMGASPSEELEPGTVDEYGEVAEADPVDAGETGADDIPEPDDPTLGEEDDTPLDSAEPLEVENTESLTPAGQDTGDSDPTAATVEESITDQTSEDLQDGVDAVADATTEIEEDSGDTSEGALDDETPLATSGDETGEGIEDVVGRTVDEEPPVDANVAAGTEVEVELDAPASEPEAGEVPAEEVTDSDADFDEGIVEVADVDMGTTDEEVEEAMHDAAEVGEWGDKETETAKLADKTIEELQNEKESLEKFRCMLEDSIANEAYSPGLLAFMNAEVEPIRRRLAKLDEHFDTTTTPRIALESYGPDVDLAYVATLESFQGMISRITTITTGILHRVEKLWTRGLVDKVTSRADALDKQIDLRLVELKASGYTTSTVSGIRGYLATDETNLVKAVADDLNIVTDIAVKGIKASEQLQTTVVKAVNDIISAGSAEEISKVLDALANVKNIKASFPNAAFEKGLLGGYKLEIREGTGSDRTEKIEALGHTGIPVGVKAVKTSESGEYTLSKGDIANLLKMAKTYVGVARKLANTTGDRAVGIATKVRTTRNRALPVTADTRIRGDEYGVDAAATAMKLLARAHLDLYKFITKHCVEVADALCGVAAKAIK